VPETIPPDQLLDALRWRYATKSFNPDRRVDPDAWQALLESLVLAPSSFGLQPWKFLVIEDPELRRQLRDASWGQAQVTEADKLVVFTAQRDMTRADIERWIARLAEVQGQQPDSLAGFTDVVDRFSRSLDPTQRHAWNVRQTYLALGQFMGAAASLGVDTCPLEGIDPAGYDRILGLDDSPYATCVACAVGHRADDDKQARRPKARYARDQVIEVR